MQKLLIKTLRQFEDATAKMQFLTRAKCDEIYDLEKKSAIIYSSFAFCKLAIRTHKKPPSLMLSMIFRGHENQTLSISILILFELLRLSHISLRFAAGFHRFSFISLRRSLITSQNQMYLLSPGCVLRR